MGVEVRVVLYAESESEAVAAARVAFVEIARLDAVFSDYRRDSELSRLAANAGGNAQPVSDDLHELLQRSQRLAHQTGGAFDVSAGALTRLWRRAIRGGALPTEAELAAAMRVSGVGSLTLDVAGTVQLPVAGTRLDLGGIAKGFALDRALAKLADAGVARALLQAGGDIVVGDPPPEEDGWTLAIAHADCVVRLSRAALSTSGDSEQFVVIEGRRYSHTVDPRTGFGLTSGRTAMVVAGDSVTADSLATALTVLEPAEYDALLAGYPGAGALVSHRSLDGGSIEGLAAYGAPAGERFAGCLQ